MRVAAVCPPTWPAPKKFPVSLRHGDAAEEVALDWVLVKGVPGDDLEGMMPDLGSQQALILQRVRDGGYMVMTGYGIDRGYPSQMLFCSADIDEALVYIRGQIVPQTPLSDGPHDA